MGKPDKMKTIGFGLDSLAVLKRPEYKKDIMEMDEEELRGALLDYKLVLKEGASKEDIVEELLNAGFTTEDVPENEEDNSIKEAEPVEEVTEAKLRVVQSPTIAETQERIQKLKEEIAGNIARGDYKQVYSDPEKFALFGQNEEEIHSLASTKMAEDRSIRPRRALSGKPFPNPRSRGEGTKAAPKKPEAPKPVAEVKAAVPLNTVLEGRTKLLDKEDLGRRSETKEDNTKAQIEQLAQKLYKNEEPTKSEREFILAHPEVQKRLGELYGNEVTPQASPEPTPEVEAAAATPEKEPAPVRENGLNGNVEFQLGKLGIIDASDPKQYEAKKKEAIAKIQKEVPNFLNLEPEKQRYILKQLEIRVNRNITNDAEAEVRAANAANKKGGWFGRQYRKIFEGSDAVKLEKVKSVEQKQKGFDGYKDDLAQLTGFVETWGVKIKEGENGDVSLQFLEGKGKTPKHQGLIDTFNSRASAMASIPSNWMTEHATAYQKKRAEFAKILYDRSQKALLAYESKSKLLSKEEKAIRSLEVTNATSDVEMAQFLAENPGLESKVNKFIKEHPVLTKAAFIALGAGARGLAKYGAAFGGGLVASSALGGFTSWVRKRDEFREIEAQRRAGKNVGKVAGIKEGVDLVGYTKKINQLIEKAKNTEDPKRKARILQTLQTRISILKDRTQNLGVVSFGSKGEELNNQVQYFNSIKEANRLLITASGVDKKVSDEVYKVFDQKYLKDYDKETERMAAVRAAFTKGALIGGTGFVGGFIAADYAFGDGKAVESAWQWTEETSRKAMGQVYMANEYLHGGFEPDNVPMDKTVRINPTTAGQSANFPENMPRPDNLPYDVNSLPQTPVAESSFGARGAIGAIKDLQRALIDQYGGNMPENLKGFVGENPDRLAIKWNMFKPEFRDESIALPRGTKFMALPDGNISIKLPDGKILGITNPTENMKFDYFDSGAKDVPPGVETTVNNQNPLAGGRTVEGVYNPEGAASGVPENVPGDPNNIRPGYDFERVKTGLENLGFRHEAVEGGDIFSADVPTGDAPEMVEGYANIDGLKVDTKEIKGTIDFLYDSKGVIKNVDLPALQVEDVSRFRANPENFIGGSHDVAERAMLGKKLMTMNSQVETFLKYRRIMEIQSLNQDSPEYRFLHEESNKLWSAIQKKVEYQFNPDYNGFRANPIENTAPMVEVPPQSRPPLSELIPGSNSNESVPVVRNLDVDGPSSTSETPHSESGIATPEDLDKERALEEAHNEEGLHKEDGKPEIVRTNRDVIPSDSILLQESFVSKYGGVESVDKNVVFFKDGHVGFYAESLKHGIAKRSAQALASANAENLGINMNRPPVPVATQIPGGPVRYLLIYEKAK